MPPSAQLRQCSLDKILIPTPASQVPAASHHPTHAYRQYIFTASQDQDTTIEQNSDEKMDISRSITFPKRMKNLLFCLPCQLLNQFRIPKPPTYIQTYCTPDINTHTPNAYTTLQVPCLRRKVSRSKQIEGGNQR